MNTQIWYLTVNLLLSTIRAYLTFKMAKNVDIQVVRYRFAGTDSMEVIEKQPN